MGFTIPGLPSVTPSTKDVTLSVQGVEYRHWKAITINRSLMQFAGSFSLTVSNRYADENEKWSAYLDQECIVKLAGEQVIDGYIDEILISYNQKNFSITFNGRDRTADLVDCNYDVTQYPGEFLNQTALKIIKKLCAPFNIVVDTGNSLILFDLLERIKQKKINAGAPVYEDINKICQLYGVLPVSYGDGKLTLDRATEFLETTDNLEGGINIKSATYNQSNRDRFGEYKIIGKLQEATITSRNATNIKGENSDESIREERTFVKRDNTATNNKLAKEKARWISRIKAGKSRPLTVIVQDWVQSDKKIWPLNRLVHVKDTKLGIDDEFLIAGTRSELGDEIGSITTLNLVHPDMLKLKKVIKQKEFQTLSERNAAKGKIPSIPGVN